MRFNALCVQKSESMRKTSLKCNSEIHLSKESVLMINCDIQPRIKIKYYEFLKQRKTMFYSLEGILRH